MNHARERNTMCSVTSDLSNDNMFLSQNVFFGTQKMFFVPAGRIGSKEVCGSGWRRPPSIFADWEEPKYSKQPSCINTIGLRHTLRAFYSALALCSFVVLVWLLLCFFVLPFHVWLSFPFDTYLSLCSPAAMLCSCLCVLGKASKKGYFTVRLTVRRGGPDRKQMWKGAHPCASSWEPRS